MLADCPDPIFVKDIPGRTDQQAPRLEHAVKNMSSEDAWTADQDAPAAGSVPGSGGPTNSTAALEALSCVSCRARKLKCCRTKPACARCVKVNAECVYPESRRKPAFKRRNVRELEERLGRLSHPTRFFILFFCDNSFSVLDAEEQAGKLFIMADFSPLPFHRHLYSTSRGLVEGCDRQSISSWRDKRTRR